MAPLCGSSEPLQRADSSRRPTLAFPWTRVMIASWHRSIIFSTCFAGLVSFYDTLPLTTLEEKLGRSYSHKMTMERNKQRQEIQDMRPRHDCCSRRERPFSCSAEAEWSATDGSFNALFNAPGVSFRTEGIVCNGVSRNFTQSMTRKQTTTTRTLVANTFRVKSQARRRREHLAFHSHPERCTVWTLLNLHMSRDSPLRSRPRAERPATYGRSPGCAWAGPSCGHSWTRPSGLATRPPLPTRGSTGAPLPLASSAVPLALSRACTNPSRAQAG
jgi:hypothetical protein